MEILDINTDKRGTVADCAERPVHIPKVIGERAKKERPKSNREPSIKFCLHKVWKGMPFSSRSIKTRQMLGLKHHPEKNS